jgi:glycosyltransferase involved in cell wall biosynthesis
VSGGVRVAQISFFLDPAGRAAPQLLEAWPSLCDVAESVQRAGGRVTVVQAAQQGAACARNGVDYRFLPLMGNRSNLAQQFLQLLQEVRPEVLHVHGLAFPRQVRALAAALPRIPILLQDHASPVPRWWRRGSWRRGCAVAAGVAFCSLEQSQPFIAAGILSRQACVFAIPESTCRFVPGDREAARAACGVHGEPLLLWVGHLDTNKDPLTVLAGVSMAAAALPGLRLACCFGSAPLMRLVQQRVHEDPALRGRVQLLGPVPHERVQTLMQAADLFVLGSHREGSGYSLIEALACGLPPLVTDIPSFRELTAQGRIGALWPVGDAAALAQRLLALAGAPGAGLRAQARAHFEAELSFESVGRKFLTAYRQLAALPDTLRGP